MAIDVLPGGWQTDVRREGDVVHRSPGPWSRSVLGMLRHLGEVGFSAAPRPVGGGFDDSGHELITYIEGTSPQPHPWSDEAVARVGQLLAELHAATADFDPPPEATWQDTPLRRLGDPERGFGHGDLGPWNIVAIDDVPVGFIDWDTAGPMDPVWELAQVGWLNAQLHDDDLAARIGLGDAASRAGQLGLLLDGYRLPRDQRRGFVDKMVEVAVHDARGEATQYGITESTVTGVGDDGYPFAWGLAWRIGSASWMLRNRPLLESAIGV